MLSFTQYITELFDKPYPFHNKDTDKGFAAYTYTMLSNEKRDWKDIIKQGGEGSVVVSFVQSGAPGNWLLTFYRNGKTSLTGEGSADRVLATAMDGIKRFLKEYKPDSLEFSAAKMEINAKTLSYTSGSRVKLYTAMVKKFAPSVGYVLAPTDDRVGSTNVDFVLKRKDLVTPNP